jgi:transcriptional regulator with GAF, ATPase, and Fis domain
MRSRQMEFFKLLSGELAPDKLLTKFLLLLLELQNVERGSLWVRAGEGFLCVEAAGTQSADIKGLRIPADRPSIVGWVFANRKLAVADTGKDSRHFRDAEDGLAIKSRRILALPLFLREGSVYGVVEIIDTTEGGERMNLSPDYLRLLQNVVDIGAIALSNSFDFMKKTRENISLREAIETMRTAGPVFGPSPAWAKVAGLLSGYARTDYPVLLTGESGTGKEVAARELHRLSARGARPFLAQNLSGIPATLLASELFGYEKGAFTGAYKTKPGLFEAASGGTVFLDEIGELSMDLQATLLRVLQDNEVKPLGGSMPRTVDVRVLCATNRDLEKAMAEGSFREDLYYRLKVLHLHLPPLRERPEDVTYFLRHFMRREAAVLGFEAKPFSAEAGRMLSAYSWPGNVRELENCVKQILVASTGPEIVPEDLPPQVRANAPRSWEASPGDPGAGMADRSWQEMERGYVVGLLEKNRWNVTRAAEEAGVKRSTFDSRMRRLGISKKGRQPEASAAGS